MRKKTIVDGRPSRHDDLVALLLANPDRLIASCGATGRRGSPELEIEVPVGRGHVDLMMTWRWKCSTSVESSASIERRGYRQQWMPGDPPIQSVPCGCSLKSFLICEVKSELEQWSAGDVIRQLKGYRTNLDFNEKCAAGHRIDPTETPLLVIFSGRPFSASEAALFRHAGVIMVLPEEILANGEAPWAA